MPTGRIKYYNLDKGFGFIAQDNSEEDVFLHSSAIKYADYEELRVGQRVKYNVVEGDKGLVAKNVEVLLTPTERRWLRQGKTIIPRGYSGFQAQNQDNLNNNAQSLPGNTDNEKEKEYPKHTPTDWKSRSQEETSDFKSNKELDEKEQSSRQLSFGDLYILKQINYETPMYFAMYNHEHLPALVLEMTLSEFTLNCNGKEKSVKKSDIKYCYKDIDAKNVTALLQYSEDIKDKQLQPILTSDEQYNIDAETVKQAQQDGNSIQITLREGEFFQGVVDWISPYEIKLVLKNGSKIVVFRHAIYDFAVVEMEE